MTLGLGFGAMNTGNNLVYLVFGMMLGLITASGVLSEMSLRGLETEWLFPSDLFAGQPATLRFILKNLKKNLPSVGLEIETAYKKGFFLYVPAGSHEILDIPFTPNARGKFTFQETKIETKFPFGFFRKWMFRESSQSFVVYPKINLDRRLETPGVPAEKNRSAQEKGRGDAYWQIRDFSHGDSPRQISWKVSAKQSRLMVRETERETDKKIFLSMGKKSRWTALSKEDLEDAISFAASLIWKNFQENFAVGFISDHLSVMPSRNRRQLKDILEYLALFDPASQASSKPHAPAPGSLDILDLWKINR